MATAGTDNAVSPAASKFCGRQFQTTADAAFADESICSKLILIVAIPIYLYINILETL